MSLSTTSPPTAAELDALLTAQIAVAWAGEGGDEPRLGWWRTDLVDEYGGEDLFARLLPHTARWAVLQAVREAARRTDARLRHKASDPDALITLYRLGFTLDERLEERLQDHKRAGKPPEAALPGLGDVLSDTWDPARFKCWLSAKGTADTRTTPSGRLLPSTPPDDLGTLTAALLAALQPLGDAYPLPHYRSAG